MNEHEHEQQTTRPVPFLQNDGAYYLRQGLATAEMPNGEPISLSMTLNGSGFILVVGKGNERRQYVMDTKDLLVAWLEAAKGKEER